MKRTSSSCPSKPSKRKKSLPPRTYKGDEWMAAGVLPIRKDAEGWKVLAVVKGTKTNLSPLKGKRQEGEETPTMTASREFNEEASGMFRTVTPVELEHAPRIYIKQGKMLFFVIDATDEPTIVGPKTVAQDRVVWAPIKYYHDYLDTLQHDLGLNTKIEPHFAFVMVASRLKRD